MWFGQVECVEYFVVCQWYELLLFLCVVCKCYQYVVYGVVVYVDDGGGVVVVGSNFFQD